MLPRLLRTNSTTLASCVHDEHERAFACFVMMQDVYFYFGHYYYHDKLDNSKAGSRKQKKIAGKQSQLGARVIRFVVQSDRTENYRTTQSDAIDSAWWLVLDRGVCTFRHFGEWSFYLYISLCKQRYTLIFLRDITGTISYDIRKQNFCVRIHFKDGSSLLHPFPNSTEHDNLHKNDKTIVKLQHFFGIWRLSTVKIQIMHQMPTVT